jgi:hypothetical protein
MDPRLRGGDIADPGGIVKTEGLGDGSFAVPEDHRQATLDDATQPGNKLTGTGFQSCL